MDSYRVFISYSRDNRQDVEAIAEILRANGLTPVYDIHIPAGHAFDDLIKRYIEHAHVFMPLITAESAERGWVHQEIGYAAAMNIPVLPVTREKLPPAMIQRLNTVTLDNNLGSAQEKLSYNVFRTLVENCPIERAMHYCAQQPEERAIMMSEMANEVRTMGFTGFLRQRGGLSSFQIPNKPCSDKVWEERYHTVLKNDFHCKCQLSERRALEAHARAEGCRLVINPDIIIAKYSEIAKQARLSIFLEFLNSMKKADVKIDIAIDEKLTFNDSVTIVGDWFCAESYCRSESQGFMQTTFACHAPYIMDKIYTFDCEFETLLEKNGTRSGETLDRTIKRIEKLMK